MTTHITCSGHKPHHQLVCLTCRSDVCDWLLSGEEKDRTRIKAVRLPPFTTIYKKYISNIVTCWSYPFLGAVSE